MMEITCFAAGSDYAPDGSLDNWWTHATWDKFRRVTNCFVEIYDQHRGKCVRVSNLRRVAIVRLLVSLCGDPFVN